MKFCKECLLPDSRPEIKINEDGVCSACVNSKTKTVIDWDKREQELKSILDNCKNPNSYDCIIPVSGGKDSTWQVYTLKKKYGMNPLAITWRCTARTELGKKNLENLIALGVSHIDYTINPDIEKKFMLETFKKTGSPSLSEHMAIWSTILNFGVKFKIPLIVFGENSAFEYGGSGKISEMPHLNSDWLKKFGVTHGTTAEDWIGEVLDRKDVFPYIYPTDDELEAFKITPIFLGHFLRWDPYEVANIAKSVGFDWADEPVLGTWEYADLDCDFIVLHHFLKWFKFGFTRSFDNLSIDIRNGRLTHDEAVEYLNTHIEKTPYKQINSLCDYLDITQADFWEIVDSHRNKNIWSKEDGKWKIKDFPDYLKFENFYPDLPDNMR